ncbi:helix-turn-helix domain-containing protein [Vallitalea okinawensis]|uniref:helix-turn-helix domain-containing protein n=1 Tax=Vallitalea okinawensis TaxID=2078660 RepID=UPI000CFD780B|nr:helix-turn-helix domain-containing protein [Vallitalea okinawensis]
MQEKSSAPALARGLEILEYVASKGEVTFNRIKEETGYHATTLNRLLKVLIEKGYLAKNSTGYCLGTQAYILSKQNNIWDNLVKTYHHKMVELNAKHHITFILVGFDNDTMVVLSKVIAPANLAMLEVGDKSTDLANFPWGILYLAEQEESSRKELMDKSLTYKKREMERVTEGQIEEQIQQAKKEGAVDDQGYYFSGRRFAVPIRSKSGYLLGALCSGVFKEKVDDINIKELINDMKENIQ